MSWLKKLFFALFGAVSWTLPPWLSFITRTLAAGRQWCRDNKKIFFGGVAAVVLAFGGYLWYQSLPQPQRIIVSGTTPSLTELKEEPVYDSIYINFSASAAKLEAVGKVISSGLTMTPALQGEWRWNSDTQIVFQPSEDWGIGQEYKVQLDKSLFPDHVKLDTYTYTFSSMPFTAIIAQSLFHQDPKDPNIKKVVATVRFSHPVDKTAFEKRIRLELLELKQNGLLVAPGEEIPYSVDYDKFSGEAYIHSGAVAIPLKDRTLRITIDDGVHAERGGNATEQALSNDVTIPGMYNYFRIARAQPTLVRNARDEPEQVLIIEATAGVKEDELQKNLEVYLLPKDKPAILGQRPQKNYRWWRIEEIGPEVLQLAEKLELTALPTETEYAQLHSFKYSADVGRTLYIRVKKGTKSYGGYVLADEFDTLQTVPQYPRELKIMYDGALLSVHGSKQISTVSRGIDALRFDIGRVFPDQINHLITQSGGQFNNPYFNNYNFNYDNISDRFTQERALQPLPANKAQYTAFDFSPYLAAKGQGEARRGLFYVKVESWDMRNKRTTGASDTRLVLITDLGMLVKDNADKSHDVFVQSIHSGRPVAEANVEILGKNGLPILSVRTDADGRAHFPDLNDFQREKTPTVFVVRKQQDLSFIPYQRQDRYLNLSRYDIGGVYSHGQQEKLDAYLFSDRGIYRPGDKFNIGMILKSSDWHTALEGIPLEVIISDSRGLTVKKQKIRLAASGFEEVDYQTQDSSPTGEYQVRLYLIKDKHRRNLLGSTSVRVEEFLPDRMKISARFSKERVAGWVSPEALQARVNLQNLYGTPATDRRIAAAMTLSPAQPVFRAYRDFRFYDPLRAERSFEQRLPDGKTDTNGEAVFDLELQRFDKATYRLKFTAEGYEAEGGRSVSAERSVLVSPLAYLIGFKADGNLSYIKKDSQRSVKLLAIDPALKSIDVNGLQIQLIEQRYVSVLTRQNDGTYKYQSVRKETTLDKQALNIAAVGSDYTLPTDKAGDYVLVIRNGADTELNRVAFSVVGAANLTRSLEKNAELQIKLNKTDFAPGEEIELQIKAPYTGAGLITIERDRVYAYRWFKSSSTSSVQKIRVPADLEGNGYVNVSFVRAMDSDEIFMSPLSYGVVPFTVSRAQRTNEVTLDVSDLARPGEPLKITYSSQKPGKIVVFAVNEGILQVAGYTTPDPLAHFFKKRALEVRTSQILDMILPEYEILQALSAPGGGDMMMEAAALGKNLNPFKRKQQKPVVYWSGIVEVDSTPRVLEYQVPDYFNGNLRIMAVAVSPDAIGVAKKQTTVRGHFVISPNVPTFVAPGDEFTVSVNVANNIEDSGNDAAVQLQLSVSEHLQILDEASRELKISEGREQSTRFRIRANDKLGSGNFTFVATHKDKRSQFSVDLSVRPPAAYMTRVSGGHVQDDKVDVPVTRDLYPHFRHLEVTASPVPLAMARGLIRYLDNYPYLCTEQLVSRAMPAIVLRNRPEFGYNVNRVEQSLDNIIHILRARQNSEGAFGFWAANSHVSNYQSIYAVHFLTEAKQLGYPIPNDLLQRGIAYLHKLAKRDFNTMQEARENAYAIYLLTRNGVVTTRYVNNLRKQLDYETYKGWQKDLTGIYLAGTYKMLKLDSDANQLIRQASIGDTVQSDYQYFYDGLMRDSQLLYVLAMHFEDRLADLKAEDIQKIVDPVNRGYFNTLSSAYTILAFNAYATAVGVPQETKVKVQELLASDKLRDLLMPPGLFPILEFSDEAKAIRIDSEDKHHLFYQVSETGFDKALPTEAIKSQLEVQREYRDAKGNVVDKATLGEELSVHVRIRTLDNKYHYNVAVVDLLPGGFEAVIDQNVRNQSGENAKGSNWTPQHVDIREDRVILFGAVGPNLSEFVYRIKATNQGQYKVPAVFAESMYERSVQARALGGSITVVKPE